MEPLEAEPPVCVGVWGLETLGTLTDSDPEPSVHLGPLMPWRPHRSNALCPEALRLRGLDLQSLSYSQRPYRSVICEA